MESSFTGSLTQLALCDDVIGWVKSFLAPVEITDDELALDAIDEVGPGGIYLLHKHTRRHPRERWQPRLFDRASWGTWTKGGSKDATARAAEVVDEILARPIVNPLPPDVAAAVHAVVEEAERRVRAQG